MAVWFIAKKKYELIIDDEVAAVREMYRNKYSEKEEPVIDFDEESKKLHQEIVNMSSEKIDDVEHDSEKEAGKEVMEAIIHSSGYSETDVKEPYVIDPAEFGMLDGFETIGLTYFADDVLTDDEYEALSADYISTHIGLDFAEHFGEYEEDSVYIRNEALATDYEILADNRAYAHVSKNRARARMED